jgi:hypothetical protein
MRLFYSGIIGVLPRAPERVLWDKKPDLMLSYWELGGGPQARDKFRMQALVKARRHAPVLQR